MPVMKEYESAAENCVAYAEGNENELIEVIAFGKVRVSRDGVRAFNYTWPCSELRDTRAYWFEFDATGDLVDCDVPESDDGSAATAMADDCRAFVLDGKLPSWAE